jgi:hypothetical protein
MGQLYNKNRHDIGITKTDGTTVGLMLVRDTKTSKPMYFQDDDEYTSQQQTQIAGYAGLPFEKEIRLGQDDWRGGFGQEIYDASDSKRSNSSTGVDGRFSHKLLAPPEISHVDMPAAVTMATWANAGFEAGDTSSWTEVELGGGTVGASNTRAHTGTWSVKITGDGGNMSSVYQQQNIDVYYRSKYVAFNVWVWAEGVATSAQLIIYDGTNTTTTNTTVADGWYQINAVHLVAAAATYIRVTYKATADTTNAYFDDLTWTAYAPAAQNCIEEFNSSLYIGVGSYLLKIVAGGTCSLIADVGQTITSLKSFADGYLYMARGLSNAYMYMSTVEVITLSTAANNKYQFFEVLDGTAPTLYGNGAVNTIRSTVNPINGGTAWSNPATEIDTAEWSITALKCIQSQLYVLKGNRPFYLDTSGNVKTLTAMTQTLASTTGGTGTAEFSGKVYMPYGRGLLEYDIANTAFDWKQPSNYGIGYSGTFGGIAGDDRYLYTALQSSTTSYIFAGHDEVIDNTTQWVWHIIGQSASTTVNGAMLSNYVGSAKRLWLLTTSATGIFYVGVPTDYGDVTTDTTYKYQTGGTITTPWHHGEFKGDKKAFISFTVVMGHTYDVDIYWTVEYQLVGDSDWTSLGGFKGSADSMTETKSFPVSNKPTSNMVRFLFTSVTDDTAKTPVLTSYYCKAILYPKRRNILRCAVSVADGVLDKMRQPSYGKKDIKDALNDIKDTATYPFVFYDIDGVSRYCKILPQKPYFEVMKSEGDKPTEEICYLNLQVVEFS